MALLDTKDMKLSLLHFDPLIMGEMVIFALQWSACSVKVCQSHAYSGHQLGLVQDSPLR